MGRGVLNFLLAIYIFFSMIERVGPEGTSPGMGTETVLPGDPCFCPSGRDIPRYGDGNVTAEEAHLINSPEGTSPGMGTETNNGQH